MSRINSDAPSSTDVAYNVQDCVPSQFFAQQP